MATSEEALAKAYERAYRSIVQRIHNQARQGLSTAYNEALLRDVRVMLAELDQEALQLLEDAIPTQYRAGMQASLKQLREISPTVAAHAEMTMVHRRAVDALVNNAIGDISTANQRIGRHVEGLLRRTTLDAITQKTISGQTVREAARSLTKTIVEKGLEPPGSMRASAYARLVARSTTREASNLGRINQGTELGQDLVQMTSHNSPCPICSQYEGRVYSVSGRDKRYPALYQTAFSAGYNNIHPNCRHGTTVYIEALADDAHRDREFSNREFVDSRSEAEKRAYQREQTRRRQQRETRDQFEKYKAVFGNDMPGLASFASMKARNSSGYRELLADYRRIGRA
jgi:hypothetical protein